MFYSYSFEKISVMHVSLSSTMVHKKFGSSSLRARNVRPGMSPSQWAEGDSTEFHDRSCFFHAAGVQETHCINHASESEYPLWNAWLIARSVHNHKHNRRIAFLEAAKSIN